MDIIDFAMWLKPLIVANAYPITFVAIMIWGAFPGGISGEGLVM